MKVVGMIAEFNPLHNGHANFIKSLKDPLGPVNASHVVTVMSGNFVQRGEPAILPKTQRVQQALSAGIDLVLELPVCWSMQSAEGFAKGAVSILNALDTIDILAFGSECGNIALLEKAVDIMESDKFQTLFHYHIDGGISYAEAQEKAMLETGGTELSALFKGPNNILGIEYIKAIRSLGSKMKCYTIKRESVQHDDLNAEKDLASAKYIRELIQNNQLRNTFPFMPPECREILSEAANKGLCPSSITNLDRALLYILRNMKSEDFKYIPGISEGLENRFYDCAQKASTIEDFLNMCKTKRYPLTRLQRILWFAYLKITKEDVQGLPPYIRPLGMTEKGMDVLRKSKNNGCPLPILSRISKAEELDEYGKRIWEIENRASDLYGLSLPTPPSCSLEKTTKIIKE